MSDRCLQPHQQRVVDEKVALDEKLAKLIAFFNTSAYSGLGLESQQLFMKQRVFMEGYSKTLAERIERFHWKD